MQEYGTHNLPRRHFIFDNSAIRILLFTHRLELQPDPYLVSVCLWWWKRNTIYGLIRIMDVTYVNSPLQIISHKCISFVCSLSFKYKVPTRECAEVPQPEF